MMAETPRVMISSGPTLQRVGIRNDDICPMWQEPRSEMSFQELERMRPEDIIDKVTSYLISAAAIRACRNECSYNADDPYDGRNANMTSSGIFPNIGVELSAQARLQTLSSKETQGQDFMIDFTVEVQDQFSNHVSLLESEDVAIALRQAGLILSVSRQAQDRTGKEFFELGGHNLEVPNISMVQSTEFCKCKCRGRTDRQQTYQHYSVQIVDNDHQDTTCDTLQQAHRVKLVAEEWPNSNNTSKAMRDVNQDFIGLKSTYSFRLRQAHFTKPTLIRKMLQIIELSCARVTTWLRLELVPSDVKFTVSERLHALIGHELTNIHDTIQPKELCHMHTYNQRCFAWNGVSGQCDDDQTVVVETACDPVIFRCGKFLPYMIAQEYKCRMSIGIRNIENTEYSLHNTILSFSQDFVELDSETLLLALLTMDFSDFGLETTRDFIEYPSMCKDENCCGRLRQIRFCFGSDKEWRPQRTELIINSISAHFRSYLVEDKETQHTRVDVSDEGCDLARKPQLEILKVSTHGHDLYLKIASSHNFLKRCRLKKNRNRIPSRQLKYLYIYIYIYICVYLIDNIGRPLSKAVLKI